MTDSSFILYSYFRSSCSYRVRIALELKQIPFEYKAISLIKEGGEQHKEDFKKVNPLAQIPYLIHEGKGLAQSMSIICYLDQLAPHPPLFPKDLYQKAQVLSFCEVINSFIQPLQKEST